MKKTSFMKKIIAVFISVLMVMTSLPITAITASAAETREKYLFAYFTGNDAASQNSATSQQIRLALSSDGINFKPLRNNAPILTPTDGSGNVRDPYIFQGHDGAYYIIGTDLNAGQGGTGFWGNQPQMVIWKSTDLCNWTNETYINTAQICGLENSQVQRTWAPEVIWDSSIGTSGGYMVYFAFAADGYNSTTMYYMTTTDLLDQSKYSKPQQLFAPGGDAIDGDIVKQNGVFYMFYKDETEGRKNVCLATATNVTGPYTYQGVCGTSSQTGAIEGCEVFQHNDGNYYLVADRYGDNGKFAIYNLGTDLSKLTGKSTINMTDGNPVTTVNALDGYSNLSARHGSIVKIPYELYKGMLNYYDNRNLQDEVFYNFDKDISLSGWNWAPQTDSSGFAYTIMTGHDGKVKGSGSNAYQYANGNYLALYGSNIFIEDESARQILSSQNFTISFDAVISTIGDSVLMGLTSGNANPNNTDWIRILDNGQIWINTGTGTAANPNNYEQIGNFETKTTVSYHLDVVYDGTALSVYVDGERKAYKQMTLGYNNSAPTNYLAFGETDQNTNAFKGAISNVRIKNEALSQSEVNYSVENANSLVYAYNDGTEYIDGRPYATNASGGIDSTYTNSLGKSFAYSVAGWVNTGSNVGGNDILLEFGNGGTTAGNKQYFNLMENGNWFYCWGTNGTDHYYDGTGWNNGKTFSPNTWYFVQINIHPYQDSTRITFFVNGEQTSTQYFNGRSALQYHDNNMLDFFNQSSMGVRFGKGAAHWGSDGSSYVDDIRVYNKTIDPQLMYTYGAVLNGQQELKQYMAEHAQETAQSSLDNFSYSGNKTDDYGSFAGDKDADWSTTAKNNGKYTYYMKNVLYGQKSTPSDEDKAKTTKSNVTNCLHYPKMTFLYDGTTELKAPMLVLSYADKSDRYTYYALDNANGLTLTDTQWYGSDQSDNWCWEYSNQVDNDIKRISGSTSTSKAAKIAAWNYSKKWYRWANMAKFSGSFGANEYYKEIYPSYIVYSGSNGTAKTTDIAITVTGSEPFRYVNYKAILDKVADAKSEMEYLKTNAWMYTEDSLQAYYEAIVPLASFNYKNYQYETHDQVVTAANAIKKVCDDYTTAKNGIKKKTFTVTFFKADGSKETKSVTAGDAIGTFEANSATKYNRDKATHTGYSWDTDLTSASVIRADVNINEKARSVDCSFSSSTTDPTCTTTGSTVYTCSVCGGSYTETIEALGHNFQTYTANYTSGQTFDSTKEYKHTSTCARGCGATNTVPCTFGEYVETTAPTETEDGVATATCTCGGTVTRVIPKLGATTYTITFLDVDGNVIDTADVEEGVLPTAPQLPENYNDIEGQHIHAWSPAIVKATAEATYQVVDNVTSHSAYNENVVAPTCTEQGYTEYTCADGCGFSYKDDYKDALGHDYTDVEFVDNGDGSHSQDCTRCDFVNTVDCSSFSEEITAPTCTNRGYTTYICDDCGYFYFGDYTDPTGHTPAEPVEENRVEPTCTVAGSYNKVVYCTNENCDVKDSIVSVEEITIPALGHDYQNVYKKGTCESIGTVAYTCSRGDVESTPVTIEGHELNSIIDSSSAYVNWKGSSVGKNHEETFNVNVGVPIDHIVITYTSHGDWYATGYNNSRWKLLDGKGNKLLDNVSYGGYDKSNETVKVSGDTFTVQTVDFRDNETIIFTSIVVYPAIPKTDIASDYEQKSHNYQYRDNADGATHTKYCSFTYSNGDTAEFIHDASLAHSFTGESVYKPANGDNNGYKENRCSSGCGALGNRVYDKTDWAAYDAAVTVSNTYKADTKRYTTDSMSKYIAEVAKYTDDVTSGDKSKSQAFIDRMTGGIQSAVSKLEIASYKVTFKVQYNSEIIEDETKEYTVPYGTVQQFAYTPSSDKYIVKWTAEDEKDDKRRESTIATTSNTASHAIYSDTTIIVYISDSVTEDEDTYSVTLIDKNENVIGLVTVPAESGYVLTKNGNSLSVVKGEDVTATLAAPKYPFYQVTDFVNAQTSVSVVDVTITEDITIKARYSVISQINIKSDQAVTINKKYSAPYTAFFDEKIVAYAKDAKAWYADGELVCYGDTYTFQASTSVTLSYSTDSVSTTMSLSRIDFAHYDADSKAFRIVVSNCVPEGATIVEQGVKILTSSSTTATVTSDKVINGTKKYVATKTTGTGNQFMYTIGVNDKINTMAVVSYVTYEINGEQTTVWSSEGDTIATMVRK